MPSQIALVVRSAGLGLAVPVQLYSVVRLAVAASPLVALT